MQSFQKRKAWATLASAALAVVAFASPAAAAAASTTTVQASPSTALVGQPVELSALVTCPQDPSGGLGVTFFDGANTLATVPVAPDGTATYPTSFTSPGTHVITAAYNGNENCDASSGTTDVEVTPAPPLPPGLCLFCGGLINFTVDNSNNNNDYTIYNITGNEFESR